MNIFIKKKKKKHKHNHKQVTWEYLKWEKERVGFGFCVVPSRTVCTLDPGLGNWHDYRAVIKVENLSYS